MKATLSPHRACYRRTSARGLPAVAVLIAVPATSPMQLLEGSLPVKGYTSSHGQLVTMLSPGLLPSPKGGGASTDPRGSPSCRLLEARGQHGSARPIDKSARARALWPRHMSRLWSEGLVRPSPRQDLAPPPPHPPFPLFTTSPAELQPEVAVDDK